MHTPQPHVSNPLQTGTCLSNRHHLFCVENFHTGPCLLNHKCKSGTHFRREHIYSISFKIMLKRSSKWQAQKRDRPPQGQKKALTPVAGAGCSGRRHSSRERETNSMAGRVCIRKGGHSLRKHHHSPVIVHVPERVIDEESEHWHEGALLGESVGEHPIKGVRRPASLGRGRGQKHIHKRTGSCRSRSVEATECQAPTKPSRNACGVSRWQL